MTFTEHWFGWTIQIVMGLMMLSVLALSFVFDPATHSFWNPLERAIRKLHRGLRVAVPIMLKLALAIVVVYILVETI